MSLIHKSTEPPPPTDWLGASVREEQRARSNEETSWMRKFLRYYYFIIIAWNYCSGTAKDSHVLNCIAVDCTLWWWLPLLRSVRLLCAKWALVLFVLRLHCRRRSAFEFRKLNLHSERARAFKNISHPPTTQSESAAVIGEGEKMSEREEGNISGINILVSQRERQREPGKWHCHYRIFNTEREWRDMRESSGLNELVRSLWGRTVFVHMSWGISSLIHVVTEIKIKRINLGK